MITRQPSLGFTDPAISVPRNRHANGCRRPAISAPQSASSRWPATLSHKMPAQNPNQTPIGSRVCREIIGVAYARCLVDDIANPVSPAGFRSSPSRLISAIRVGRGKVRVQSLDAGVMALRARVRRVPHVDSGRARRGNAMGH